MKKVLLRNYIYDRLYHPTAGYFCKSDLQIGEMKHPLNFKKMIGYDDYQKALVELYPKNAWLTPSEIFKPYYGMTIANYILQAHARYQEKDRRKKPINIIEVGAGTGSAAESILYYFRSYETELYDTMNYTVVELSEQLCKKCEQKLQVDNHRMMTSKRLKVVNKDIANYKQDSGTPTYVLFFEVMDNLPHDRVILSNEKDKPHQQTLVDIDTNEEELVPVSDQLVKQCLDYYLKLPKNATSEQPPDFSSRIAAKLLSFINKKQENSRIVFLPTYLLKVLYKIKSNIPGAHLVMSDFDSLPSSIPGIFAPIVSKKGQKSNQKTDFNSYIVQRGSADIFFPTNFELVKLMHEGVLSLPGQHLKSHQFIREFSKQKWAQTRSGFNPFKQDFLNTSFFLTKI